MRARIRPRVRRRQRLRDRARRPLHLRAPLPGIMAPSVKPKRLSRGVRVRGTLRHGHGFCQGGGRALRLVAGVAGEVAFALLRVGVGAGLVDGFGEERGRGRGGAFELVAWLVWEVAPVLLDVFRGSVAGGEVDDFGGGEGGEEGEGEEVEEVHFLGFVVECW